MLLNNASTLSALVHFRLDLILFIGESFLPNLFDVVEISRCLLASFWKLSFKFLADCLCLECDICLYSGSEVNFRFCNLFRLWLDSLLWGSRRLIFSFFRFCLFLRRLIFVEVLCCLIFELNYFATAFFQLLRQWAKTWLRTIYNRILDVNSFALLIQVAIEISKELLQVSGVFLLVLAQFFEVFQCLRCFIMFLLFKLTLRF